MKTNIFSDTEKKSRSIEVYVDQNDFSWKKNNKIKKKNNQANKYIVLSEK